MPGLVKLLQWVCIFFSWDCRSVPCNSARYEVIWFSQKILNSMELILTKIQRKRHGWSQNEIRCHVINEDGGCCNFIHSLFSN
jgi:hypothetical protein